MPPKKPLVLCHVDDSASSDWVVDHLEHNYSNTITPHSFYSPRDANAFITSNPVDVLISDLTFPEQGGFQAVIQMIMQAKRRNPNVTIVVVTGRENITSDALTKMGQDFRPSTLVQDAGDRSDSPLMRERAEAKLESTRVQDVLREATIFIKPFTHSQLDSFLKQELQKHQSPLQKPRN
jgi:CheY-like chemotaxis protein